MSATFIRSEIFLIWIIPWRAEVLDIIEDNLSLSILEEEHWVDDLQCTTGMNFWTFLLFLDDQMIVLENPTSFYQIVCCISFGKLSWWIYLDQIIYFIQDRSRSSSIYSGSYIEEEYLNRPIPSRKCSVLLGKRKNIFKSYHCIISSVVIPSFHPRDK